MSRNNLSSIERTKLQQVLEFAPASTADALEALRNSHWDVQGAIEDLLDGAGMRSIPRDDPRGSKPEDPAKYAKIDAWFDTLRDEPDGIEANGIMKLASQLDIDPETDPAILLLAKNMQAKQMLYFSREEFRRGMMVLECDSSAVLKSKLGALRDSLKNKKVFKELYLFLYSYALDAGQKVMTKDMAAALWKLLLPPRFPLFSEWIEYFEKNHKHGVSKDVWNQLLVFMELPAVNERNFEEFDKIDAWPLLLDEFVAYIKAKDKA